MYMIRGGMTLGQKTKNPDVLELTVWSMLDTMHATPKGGSSLLIRSSRAGSPYPPSPILNHFSMHQNATPCIILTKRDFPLTHLNTPPSHARRRETKPPHPAKPCQIAPRSAHPFHQSPTPP